MICAHFVISMEFSRSFVRRVVLGRRKSVDNSYLVLKESFCFASMSVRDDCLHVKRVVVFLEPKWQPNAPDVRVSDVLNHVFRAIWRGFVKVLKL